VRVGGECGDDKNHGGMPSTPPPAAFPEHRSRPVSGLASWSKDRVYRLPMIAHSGIDIPTLVYRCGGSTGLKEHFLPVSRLTE
jgi:hypothetical protein